MTGHRKWREVMGSREQRNVPAQETRGGDKVDWANAVPGEPLPELPDAEYLEPDSLDTAGVVTDSGE